MDVREMHYDFKQKLNKIDSQINRNLKVPEIDWKLNEAYELFVKLIAFPRKQLELGFELNRRTIDDIRSIVVDQSLTNALTPTVFDSTSYIVVPPTDYWFLLKTRMLVTKGTCVNVEIEGTEVQHDDKHEKSPFDRSNFEWRVVNVRYNKDGLRLFTDGTFSINKVGFEYIKRPKLIHNAADFNSTTGTGTYTTLTGVALTGRQNCELPEGVHRDIVDLAVLIAAGDISLPDYQYKQSKVVISN